MNSLIRLQLLCVLLKGNNTYCNEKDPAPIIISFYSISL